MMYRIDGNEGEEIRYLEELEQNELEAAAWLAWEVLRRDWPPDVGIVHLLERVLDYPHFTRLLEAAKKRWMKESEASREHLLERNIGELKLRTCQLSVFSFLWDLASLRTINDHEMKFLEELKKRWIISVPGGPYGK